MAKMLVILLLFFLSCVPYTKYIPNPESDIERWIGNFDQQRSFSYIYKLQTKSISTEAKGDCVIGRGEHICGVWYDFDKNLEFEYIGLGFLEYSRKNGGWQKASRGDESNVFAQIRRLLEFDKFEYIGSDKEFLYRFKANIPFLVPGRWKEMVGLMKISRNNYLPEVIWAGLSDSSVYLEIRLHRYNKKKEIESPVDDWFSYLLAGQGEYLKDVKRRLKLIDVDYRIKREDEDIILTVPNHFNLDEIKTMLSNRLLNVYKIAQSKDDAIRVGYLNNDVNTPLYLADKILDQDDIKDAKLKFDATSRPYIHLSLKAKITPAFEVAFEVNGIIIQTAMLDTVKKINKLKLYTDMGYQEMEILRASLLHPLPSINIKPFIKELN